MDNLIVNQDFVSGWLDQITGDGAMTVTNNVLRCTGTSGNSAYKQYWFPIKPGQIIEVEVFAKNQGATSAAISLDITNVDQANRITIDYVNIVGNEWKKYKLKVVVPFNNNSSHARLVLGKWASQTGNYDASFQSVTIKVQNQFGGVPMVLARGLVRVLSGVPTVAPNYPSFGISSIAIDANKTALNVSLNKPLLSSMKPLVFVSGTADSKFVPVAGNVDSTLNLFKISWTDGTTFLDLTTATTLYAFIKVEM